MTELASAQCWACRHLRREPAPVEHDPNGAHVLKLPPPPRCDAFPDGIPAGMILLLGDHRLPLPDDHGVRFEQAGGADAADAFTDWRMASGNQ